MSLLKKVIQLWGRDYEVLCEGEPPAKTAQNVDPKAGQKEGPKDWGLDCTLKAMGKKIPVSFGSAAPDDQYLSVSGEGEGEMNDLPKECFRLTAAGASIFRKDFCERQFLPSMPQPPDEKNWSDYDFMAWAELKQGPIDLMKEGPEALAGREHFFELAALVSELTGVSMAEILATVQVESGFDPEKINPELHSACPALGMAPNAVCREVVMERGFGSRGLGHFFWHPNDSQKGGAAWNGVTSDPEFQALWNLFHDGRRVANPKRGESVFGDLLGLALYHRQHAKRYDLPLDQDNFGLILARRAAYNMSPRLAEKAVPYFLGRAPRPAFLSEKTEKEYRQYAKLVLQLDAWLKPFALNMKI